MDRAILKQQTVRGLADLAANVPVPLRVHGDCMRPALLDGMQVVVAPRRLYWPGDVIVCHAASRGLIAHRVIGCYPRRGGLRYLTQADTSIRPDRAAVRDAIVGKVLSVVGQTTALRVSTRERFRSVARFVTFLITRFR